VGAFIVNGLTPGPFLFQERPDLVWAVIASFFIGNVILLVLNLPLVGLWAKILEVRSEEHTSELQSLMRISYAVFCLKKKNKLSITNIRYQQLIFNQLNT